MTDTRVKQSTVHNLAHVLLTFFDSADYDNVELRRDEAGKLSVFFKDSMYRTQAKFSINFVMQDSPVILDYATDNPKLEGMFEAGYPGLRNTFLLTAGDETHITKYWARRKKPKAPKARKLGELSRITKEVQTQQINAAKALLATLDED